MRLIDADALKEYEIFIFDQVYKQALAKGANPIDAMRAKSMCESIVGDIDKQPTIDPVKHGHWEMEKHGHWEIDKLEHAYRGECSQCHESFLSGYKEFFTIGIHYCPHCGARMDEEAK